MITRNDVINNAERFLNLPPWTPQRDEQKFPRNNPNPDHTFHSAFRRGRQYQVMPYCYGGSDSVGRFESRINQRTCPGGWDRISGRSTSYWYQNLGYEFQVPANLAGIDCAGYVAGCWEITRRGITISSLPQTCLRIKMTGLKPGDILDLRGRHVRIFKRWVGAQADIYEAIGGGFQREFRAGDEIGRVVHHIITLAGSYIPYSPFPQFEVIEPTTSPVGARPTLYVRIKGSGQLEYCNFILDNTPIIPRATDNPTKGIMNVIYTPNYDLMPGRHSLSIEAINNIANQSFKDKFSLEFVTELM